MILPAAAAAAAAANPNPNPNPYSSRLPPALPQFVTLYTPTRSPPRLLTSSRFSPLKPSPFLSTPAPRALPVSSPLTELAPYVQSEWEPILKGWICSAISVYCLSIAVPRVGKLPSTFVGLGYDKMAREGLALAGLALARCAVSYLQQAFLWEAALRSAYRLRARVFDRVLERDMGFFEGKEAVPVGDVTYRITAEASDVADTVYALLNSVLPNALQLAVMATQMVVISPALSFISALVIPFISVIIAYLGEKLRKISKESNLCATRLSAYLNEVLPSMIVVKANSTELKESLQFQKLAHNDMVQFLKKRKMKALIPQILQVICIGGLLALCAGSLLVSKGSCDSSKFFSFVMSLALLVDPVQGVGKAYDELKQGEPAMEHLFGLMRFSTKVIEKANAVDLASVTGDIKFCCVTFKYGDNMPPVLDCLDLHIKSGERVALIGPSGGGKTTLTKLLLRLYDPLQGHILVDNHDVQDVTLRSLREHIILVSQDIMLFSGTVAENIGYRDLIGKIDMERVENAARIANADEFIRTLPEGYKTNIGQRGSLLSGGQKQRLAIARALYQKSSILILDEATSALDSRCELLVRQALERLVTNRTVLLIAHRPETVLMADRVLILDGGKLEEVSKPSFLSQDGCYSLLASSKHIV